MKDLELQEQAEKWCEENTDKHGFCDDAEKAFIQGVKLMQEKYKQSFELKLKEAYNLGVYRGKCQILYPNSKDPFITFEEYYIALPSPPKTK